jgi:hypothetical protein
VGALIDEGRTNRQPAFEQPRHVLAGRLFLSTHSVHKVQPQIDQLTDRLRLCLLFMPYQLVLEVFRFLHCFETDTPLLSILRYHQTILARSIAIRTEHTNRLAFFGALLCCQFVLFCHFDQLTHRLSSFCFGN